MLLFLALILVLLFLSALFSLSETSLMAANRFKLKYLEERGDRRAARAAELLRQPDKLLGTILIGDNLIDVAVGALAAFFITSVIGSAQAGLYSFLASGLLAIILIIFGKLLPKTIAASKPEPFALAVVFPLRLFILLLKPVVWIATLVSNAIARLFGFSAEAGRFVPMMSEEELRSLITSHGLSVVGAERQQMLHGVFEISDTVIKEVMVPRVEVVAVDVNASPGEIIRTLYTSGYSRIPVYRDKLDNILGVLYSKDVLPYLSHENGIEEFKVDLPNILHPAHFVPDTARIDRVLRELQRLHIHMAIVVDEFGGVEGIVTLEDILEEIVGEIHDEYDTELEQVKRIAADTYLVKGGLAVREFNKALSLQIPEDNDYATVAGFLIALTGRLLREGDTVKYENLLFEVQKVQGLRIDSIKVQIKGPAFPENRPPRRPKRRRAEEHSEALTRRS